VRRMLIAGGVVGAFGAVAWGAEPRPPAPDPEKPVNYIAWINETFGGHVKNNAFDTYQAAYQLITPFEGDWGDTTDKPWTENAAVTEWLRRNQRGLEKFKEAAAQQECFFSVGGGDGASGAGADTPLAAVLLMADPKHRDGARGLLAEGFRALGGGEPQKLVDNALLTIRSAHHIDTRPDTMARLRAVASSATAYEALLTVLEASADRDALAVELLPRLQAADPSFNPLSRVLLVERVQAWDFICRDVAEPVAARKGMLATVNRYYDALDEWTAQPYYVAAGRTERLDQIVKEIEGSPVASFVDSGFVRARQLDERLCSLRRATHLILRLHVYHKENGKFPPSLDELQGGDIGPLRIDPFSGDYFVYQKRRASFKLHTVGVNLTDDGGQHDERWREKDYVFWPRKD